MSSINVIPGRAYHIDDSFFTHIDDPCLMPNKLNGNYRPNFVLFPDPYIKGMYWAIPMSSQIEKYSKIIEDKIKKYGVCDNIVIGNYGGKNSAFLIQNMFPISEKYILREHTINGKSVPIDKHLQSSIINKARHCLKLYQEGRKVFFTDVKKIYILMKNDIQ